LHLGDLKEVTKGMYELQIGNHLLKGKSVDLLKPLIMTEKIVSPETNELEYQIKAIIRRKIMFGSRPTPLRRVED
jgi:hypothetical protein